MCDLLIDSLAYIVRSYYLVTRSEDTEALMIETVIGSVRRSLKLL
jgi:hypothetical protein